MERVALLVVMGLFASAWCDSCTNEGPCKAKCGGTSFDLTKLLDGQSVSEDEYTYTFACGGGKECGDKPNSVVCQAKATDSTRQWSLGVANATVWTLVNKSPIRLQITYSNGDGENGKLRSSDISIVVNKTSQSFLYIGEDGSTATYSFSITTTADMIYASSGGVSAGIIGWVIILLAISAFIIYFIVGAIIMYKVRGARGVEIIPQYVFWKDFPFLLVDGCFFVISPCYKRSDYQKI